MINGVDLATFRGLKDGRTNNLWSTAFSPDGKVLAAAGRHEQIYLWSTENPGTRTDNRCGQRWHPRLVFTPDGKWLISSSGEFQSHGEIMVWDPVSGDSILAIPSHTDRTKSIALSPRGDWLISTSDDKTVKLWNIGAAILRHRKKPQITQNPSRPACDVPSAFCTVAVLYGGRSVPWAFPPAFKKQHPNRHQRLAPSDHKPERGRPARFKKQHPNRHQRLAPSDHKPERGRPARFKKTTSEQTPKASALRSQTERGRPARFKNNSRTDTGG